MSIWAKKHLQRIAKNFSKYVVEEPFQKEAAADEHEDAKHAKNDDGTQYTRVLVHHNKEATHIGRLRLLGPVFRVKHGEYNQVKSYAQLGPSPIVYHYVFLCFL